jgi:hypothetical protein
LALDDQSEDTLDSLRDEVRLAKKALVRAETATKMRAQVRRPLRSD